MPIVHSARLSLDSIFSPVSEELLSVESLMRSALSTGFPDMDRCSSYVIDGGGKRIRSALVLLCSGLRGQFPQGVHRIAAGAEIVHAATLLHDDVIDGAKVRRGRPTVSSRWDNRTAVLLGDFMLAKALDIAVSTGRRDLYSPLADAAKEMVAGEFLQSRYSGISEITESIYYDIITGKTGVFMGACCFIGAAISDFTGAECGELRAFGTDLGTAFQIIDDTLDYVSDESRTGKDRGNDYFTGKITLPVILARDRCASSEKKLLAECFGHPTEEGWATVRRIVAESGSAESCAERARDLAEKGISRLGGFPESVCRGILEDLSRFIVERVY